VRPEAEAGVLVVGGGRWARVIIETLCAMLDADVPIRFHSPNGRAAMGSWVRAKGLEARVADDSTWPLYQPGNLVGTIIANRARDHYSSTVLALAAGSPVLVEKPLTLHSTDTERLVDMARALEVQLFTSHVFLFATATTALKERLITLGGAERVSVDWTDPVNEVRHGEVKSFDPAVPIHWDWIPHVGSVLGFVLPDGPDGVREAIVTRGGARVEVYCHVGGTQCVVRLERESDCRRRRFVFETRMGDVTLDLSHGNGVVSGPGDSDREIGAGPSGPLATMLGCFLRALSGQSADPRLNASVAQRTNRLIETVDAHYTKAAEKYLVDWVLSGGERPDLAYAAREILHQDGSEHFNLVEEEAVRRLLRGVVLQRDQLRGPNLRELVRVMFQYETRKRWGRRI
jgi:predicted dehydrogenase